MIRFLALMGTVVLMIGGDAPAVRPRTGAGLRSAPPAVAAPARTVVVYALPVPGPLRVLRPFDPPTTPYGPGHRGVDLDVTSGLSVRSAASGLVTFAGQVAGRGVVVVGHADGIATEYEPVRPSVAAGATVQGGEPIGRLDGVHPGCASPRCLHWGARRGEIYVDPLALLHPLGPVRLLPWPRDG